MLFSPRGSGSGPSGGEVTAEKAVGGGDKANVSSEKV